MRILCIHAFGQNGQTFRQATGGMRKLLKSFKFEYDFIDAPHQLQGGDPSKLGWWFNDKDTGFKAQVNHDTPFGLEESLQTLRKSLTDNKYSGVIAFSQGAALVSLLCLSESTAIEDLKFTMLFGAFPSRCSLHVPFYTKDACDLPTLFIGGETDDIIPIDLTKELAECFSKKKFLWHPGGHFVPVSSKHRDDYVNFVGDAIEDKFS